jgi:molybdopterin/thiamine biosynthesis adenylyltransferase
MRWWERYPERLKRERQALTDTGIVFAEVQEALARGIYQLQATGAIDGERHSLLITYPDHFPFFRFEVQARDLSLREHQHPFEKNLCLLGRATDQWNTDDTAASVITRQLPSLLATARATGARESASMQQPQAEPFSDYYPYAPMCCLVDSSWPIPERTMSGTLVLGVTGVFVSPTGPLPSAAVLEVRDQAGQLLAEASSAIREAYGRRLIQGRWSRSSEAVRSNDAKTVFLRGRELDVNGTLSWAALGGFSVQVQGILFPEEIRHRRSGDGWVFVVRVRTHSRHEAPARQDRRSHRRGRKPPWPQFRTSALPAADSYHFSRAGRSGEADLFARIPELRPLREHTVAQFGTGCLGAASALEFARAGIGELRLLDGDVIDAATTVRWPLGLAVAGRLKVEVVAAHIREHWPHTRIGSIYQWRLGSIRNDAMQSEEAILDGMLRNASLVYDATAEFGVQHFLSEEARARAIPYVGVSATLGGWGGLIVRIRPGQTKGCWSCLQAARNSGLIPNPPSDPAGQVQPAGCADPTFTGASFELAQVSMQAVRVAVATLTGGTPGAFPDFDWDVAIISLRSDTGQPIGPVVTTFTLERDATCPSCRNR